MAGERPIAVQEFPDDSQVLVFNLGDAPGDSILWSPDRDIIIDAVWVSADLGATGAGTLQLFRGVYVAVSEDIIADMIAAARDITAVSGSLIGVADVMPRTNIAIATNATTGNHDENLVEAGNHIVVEGTTMAGSVNVNLSIRFHTKRR